MIFCDCTYSILTRKSCNKKDQSLRHKVNINRVYYENMKLNPVCFLYRVLFVFGHIQSSSAQPNPNKIFRRLPFHVSSSLQFACFIWVKYQCLWPPIIKLESLKSDWASCWSGKLFFVEIHLNTACNVYSFLLSLSGNWKEIFTFAVQNNSFNHMASIAEDVDGLTAAFSAVIFTQLWTSLIRSSSVDSIRTCNTHHYSTRLEKKNFIFLAPEIVFTLLLLCYCQVVFLS